MQFLTLIFPVILFHSKAYCISELLQNKISNVFDGDGLTQGKNDIFSGLLANINGRLTSETDNRFMAGDDISKGRDKEFPAGLGHFFSVSESHKKKGGNIASCFGMWWPQTGSDTIIYEYVDDDTGTDEDRHKRIRKVKRRKMKRRKKSKMKKLKKLAKAKKEKKH